MAKAKRKDEPHENNSLVVLPPPPPRGRPTLYTDELATEICDRIAVGETLSRICLDEAMPDRVTVWRWLRTHQDFLQQYDIAREAQGDFEFDEMLDIADDSGGDFRVEMTDAGPKLVFDGEHVARTKLRLETRRWRAERLNRRKYGAKVEHELTANGHPPAGQDVLPPGLGFLAGKLPSSDAA